MNTYMDETIINTIANSENEKDTSHILDMMMSYGKQIEKYSIDESDEIDVLEKLNSVMSEFRREMVLKKLNQD